MSEKTYRDQIDRCTKELATLRKQEANATARLASTGRPQLRSAPGRNRQRDHRHRDRRAGSDHRRRYRWRPVRRDLLMLLFRQRYPRWWFDFARELTRFEARISAYPALLTDMYPSTVDEQAVHLELDYPDAERDLNRWLPLVK